MYIWYGITYSTCHVPTGVAAWADIDSLEQKCDVLSGENGEQIYLSLIFPARLVGSFRQPSGGPEQNTNSRTAAERTAEIPMFR